VSTHEHTDDTHLRKNRQFWDADADDYQAAHGAALEAQPLAWGAFRIPETDLRILGDMMHGDVLELGCGAGQWTIALREAGARCIGLDMSISQLRHARARSPVPLVNANGEVLPLRDASFDVVFCDHGAASFCNPEILVPEVARVLRTGGLFAFCATHPLLYLTWDDERERNGRRLRHSYDYLGFVDDGEGTVDWVLPPGEWISLFRRHGFVVEDLIELRAPAGATTTYTDFVRPRWARRWPAEWIWRARLVDR
jgi:SAM-dependent methyltransferase